MTEAFYHTHPEVFDLDVKVASIDSAEVSVEPNPFYPNSGGQLADKGYLSEGDNTYVVIDAIKVGHQVLLKLDPPLPEAFLDHTIQAHVDKEIRRIHTRMHTATHVLNGVIYKNFKALVTGVQIHSDGTARMDFNLPDVPNSKVRELEGEVNEYIKRDIPVKFHRIPFEEALKTPGLIRTENRMVPVDTDGMVRVVELEGLDSQTCGGTHLTSTGDCGPLVFEKIDNKGRGNRRVRIRLKEI